MIPAAPVYTTICELRMNFDCSFILQQQIGRQELLLNIHVVENHVLLILGLKDTKWGYFGESSSWDCLRAGC